MNHAIISQIQSQPGVCGGKPCIAGTRVRVQDIYVWHELQSVSADQIVSRFPQITLASVYSALAFYWEHRDEVQHQMQEESAFVETLKKRSPSPLAQKMVSQEAPQDPLSS